MLALPSYRSLTNQILIFAILDQNFSLNFDCMQDSLLALSALLLCLWEGAIHYSAGDRADSPSMTAVGRLDLVTGINVPELGQSENERGGQPHPRPQSPFRSGGSRKRRRSGPFSCMNWSIMEWRGCRGFVMPSSDPPDVGAAAAGKAAPWGHGGTNCVGILSILRYFLPVPKMGTTSRRDGVIAKCEKSRQGERESVNIFAAKIRFASKVFGEVGRVGGWETARRRGS